MSDQAKDSFIDFVDELKEFGERSEDGDRKTSLLIVDADSSAMIYTRKEQDLLMGSKLFDALNLDRARREVYYHSYPESSCNGKIPCACLCRKYNIEKGEEFNVGDLKREDYIPMVYADVDTVSYLRVSCDKMICKELEDLKFNNAWMVERSRNERIRQTDTTAPRRNFITFKKENGVVSLEVKES